MKSDGRFRTAIVVWCLAAVALALGACREEERGRILNYEKGTYLGPADQSLDQEQLNALRYRATNQRFQ